MSDDKTTRQVKGRGRREQDKRALKPEPLPIRARSDIFASTEATHLLEKPDVTALLETIDDSGQQRTQSPDKTQILRVPNSKEEISKAELSTPRPKVPAKTAKEFKHQDNNVQTQLLKITTNDDIKEQSINEHTRVLNAQFTESEERTAFFDAH
ncbi:MAG: hypothetical protein ACPGQS_13340, partial [Bradymonadia bacterium]